MSDGALPSVGAATSGALIGIRPLAGCKRQSNRLDTPARRENRRRLLPRLGPRADRFGGWLRGASLKHEG